MPDHEHSFCHAYNADVAVALACIAVIRWEMGDTVLGDSKLPRAIHSRMGSIGVPLLEWCLWVLRDIFFAVPDCLEHNTRRINAATDALVVLSSFISDPRGLQLVLRRYEIVDIVVHAWASAAGLAFCRDAVLPSMLLLDKLHGTPQLHDLVVESLARYMTAVPLQILRHVAAFSHRDLEPLPDPSLRRLPVEIHIQLMVQLCDILPTDCATLFIAHKAPKWVSRALARVLTIPFEDWEGPVEVLMNPFKVLLTFHSNLFELDPSLISMKAALRHKLVQSLVRCLSEVSRQKRLGLGCMISLSCAPVLEAVILQVYVGVRTSGTILRLACRALDSLDLVQEEKERFLTDDEESLNFWAAWDVLKNNISRVRNGWVVDPNVRSGGRCMNPQVGLPESILSSSIDVHLVVCCALCTSSQAVHGLSVLGCVFSCMPKVHVDHA